MKYVFHPEALTEYAEAVQYYTKQRVEVAQAFIAASLADNSEVILPVDAATILS
jgi:hypothetical protein